MDAKIKKCCPSCSQFYNIKPSNPESSPNIPLFLSCGHSMCKTCIKNIVKFAEPIKCRVCHQDMQVSLNDLELFKQNKIPLYNLFPVDFCMVGELALQSIEPKNNNQTQTENDCFINIKELIKSIEAVDGECGECHKRTSKICEQCDIIVCKDCFQKTHNNFVMFQKHVLKPIEKNPKNKCKSHPYKQLDYYCKDCSKSICVDCIMFNDKSCKGHCICPIQDVNKDVLTELVEIKPEVDKVFRRLTKTAVEIGDSLTKLNDDSKITVYSTLINKIDAYFSKINFIVQQQKYDITQQVLQMKTTEIYSLNRAKNDVAENIKKVKTFLTYIESLKPDQLQEINIPALLEEAKAAIKTPWHLKLESDRSIELIFREDVYTALTNFIQLEGNENIEYRLYNTEELTAANEDIPTPPSSIVYPPEFVKGNNRLAVEPGTSFHEIQQLKQLVEGSKELIYVSHIVDPYNFYVQRASQQGRVQELIREFKNAVSYERPHENHVTEGNIYLVYNQVDNFWQRCRIVGIDRRDANNTIYQVFCFDFGCCDAVKIDKLRYIPPARIETPPPFAISCTLTNCVPTAGVWTRDVSYLIHKIINNKKSVMHVRRVHRMSSGSVRLECDITTFEDGVSVVHALAFLGYARLPVELPYPKMLGILEKPKIFIGNSDCRKNSVEEVVLTYVMSPDHFFVRELHVIPVYEQLCESLEREYNLSNPTDIIYLPEKSMACVANIEKCGYGATWARAVVIDLPGRSCVRVLLADIGAIVVLPWTALRRIRSKYTMQRALARECHLTGVMPVNRVWISSAVALLQSFQNRRLEMHIEDVRNHNSLGITLYDKNDEMDIICINEQMIKNKFAVTFGLFAFNKGTTTEELVFTNNQPLENQVPKPYGEGFVAKDKGPLRLEARILNYQSPSLIYVSLVHQQNVFSKLFENIQKYYSKYKTEGKTDWKVGDRCCTICNQSQTWRRAVILELENENAKVFYTDFACVENVPVLSLREITQELASIGDAAIMCHLHGVIPAIGEEWPSLTKEFLKELIDAYNRFFITKIGKFKGKSMPIELWVYHTIQGGALEPNFSEWRCLNTKIIHQGLGIPERQENENEIVTDTTGDEVLSFFNITGSVRDWLQIEPMPLQPLRIKSDSESNASTPALFEIDTANEEPQSSNTVFISDWLPAEPLPTNEFTAVPTYIDNEGVIYLHDITQNDTLDLIRKALDVRFSHPDPKAKSVKWTVGEPCIALFFLDNKFYRGRVMDVNNETSKCLIHYIDYGNEEFCDFENLRKSIVLYQIPTQAHKCVFNRIRPVNNHWATKSLDYIHKSIVEKQCYVKVSGPSKDGLTPIEIKYDKLWINDHLVDFDMAVYTDGSKALVRKYAPTVKVAQELEQSIGSDSGPDYIVEYNEAVNATAASASFFQPESYDGKDWVHVMEKEENQPINDNYITYLPYTKAQFMCKINVLNDLENLELTIIHDDETAKAYENMFKELQNEVKSLPALNAIYENKACVALFSEDDMWYRASILQYSEAKKRIKVKYIDYGNIDILRVSDVKEITEKYTRIPPGSLTVTLHGVKNNPDIEKNTLVENYKKIFFDKDPFNAKVIDDTNIIPSVELRNEDGQLIYESLIEQNILIKCD